MKREIVSTDLHTYLRRKGLLAVCTLLACQVLFLVSNRRIFHLDGMMEWTGCIYENVVFALATVAMLYAPFYIWMLIPTRAKYEKRWYRFVGEVLYVVPTLLMVIPRGCNSAYYQYTYRLLSDEIFSYLGISGQMGSLLPRFAVDYWYAWVVPVCIMVAFFLINRRIRYTSVRAKYWAYDVTGIVLGVAALWFFTRGGFGKFMQPSFAAANVQPKNSALVSNDAYNILYTLFKPDIEQKEYMSEEEAARLMPTVHEGLAADSTTSDHRRNVVLLIVESLGQEFMGCYNTQADADTRTPFLDSLASISTVYDGRANGKKSIEGITAITTSIPNLMSRPFTNSAYGRDDEYIGLPTVLKRHGYRCGFFHGSYNGVMGFDSTCYRLGFDEYHGKDEYEAEGLGKTSDYDGVWGIYDEPFLQYTIRRINEYNEPFLAEIFTVTSHHPFPIPEEHKGEFAEGRHPILKCVEYMDYSVRRFFEEASKQPWFDSTLFIIVGDHSGHGLTREYNDYDGWYRIPMIVFDPMSQQGRRDARIVQQTDIYPSLLDYLHLPDTVVTFGQSVLRDTKHGWYIYYANGYYCMVQNDERNPQEHRIATLFGEHTTGNVSDVDKLKAIVQQYNDRVANNKLVIKK